VKAFGGLSQRDMPNQSGHAVLTKRQLNRALLARQMLLMREKTSAFAAIERLAGMQAQVPRPPFVGLWTRLAKFERQDLMKLVRDRKVVRATFLRGTIHLLATKDFVDFRPLLAPMLEKGADGIVGKQMASVDLERLHALGREFFGKTPAPFDAFRDAVCAAYPHWDVRACAYTVRMGIPLVMVPGDAAWGWPASAGFTLADTWLGAKAPRPQPSIERMVRRYLAAYGPATPADFQTWSYIRGQKDAFEELRPKLVTFLDEKKRELFDLPDAPRPAEDTPAPVRFLPEYDNILLSHADRARILDEAHRPRVFLKNLMVLGTFLVDGFVAGTWKVERKKTEATLQLTPFGKLTKAVTSELEAEGTRLLGFIEPDAAKAVVRTLATPAR
jgi:hypothetical protein